MHKYYPILLSKDGEIKAMTRLEQRVKNEVSPIIQVLAINDSLTNFLRTHWSFTLNRVILDFSLFPNLSTTTREVKDFLDGIFRAGVQAVPCVQDNSPQSYLALVKQLIASQGCAVCVKASNDSGGFNNYSQQVNNMLQTLQTTPANVILLLDLGYAQAGNYIVLANVASYAMQSLGTLNNWLGIVVASGSFPENLSNFEPASTAYRITRHEWNLWQYLNTTGFGGQILYGDFGTKYPIYQDVDSYAASISVKYTSPTHFVIYRGQRTDLHADGHGQYITHASRLIRTADYPGNTFSWGDEQIHEKAHQNMNNVKRKTGNPATWVQYSQNHHITLLHSLL